MIPILLSATLLFPIVQGNNLHGTSFVLPDDLTGQINIVVLAFEREQQEQVNTWLPLLKEIEAEHDSVLYWELPTISRGHKWMSWMIDSGMRSGIPDSTARARTITLYINRDPFLEKLDILDMEKIQVFLLDEYGYVRWRVSGPHTDEAGAQLRRAVEALMEEQSN